MISTEAMCLGVLLDSSLTFASHVRRLSGKSFYHLRQMNTMCKSLTKDAATTMVHAVVTSYINEPARLDWLAAVAQPKCTEVPNYPHNRHAIPIFVHHIGLPLAIH